MPGRWNFRAFLWIPSAAEQARSRCRKSGRRQVRKAKSSILQAKISFLLFSPRPPCSGGWRCPPVSQLSAWKGFRKCWRRWLLWWKSESYILEENFKNNKIDNIVFKFRKILRYTIDYLKQNKEMYNFSLLQYTTLKTRNVCTKNMPVDVSKKYDKIFKWFHQHFVA